MTQPSTSRRKQGWILIAVGVGIYLVGAGLWLGNKTGLFPTVPFAGSITTAIGVMLHSVGYSFIRGLPVSAGLEKRSTSLVIVVPALLLFIPGLAGALALFAGNFDQPTTPGRWVGTGVFLAISGIIVVALIRDLIMRWDRRLSGMSGPVTPAR